jgi:16S rRNA (cytidine1402-2'-O)-methyltransferase
LAPVPPPGDATEVDEATLAAAVAVLVAGGMSRRDAVDRVAAERGIGRRRVYDAANREKSLPDRH